MIRRYAVLIPTLLLLLAFVLIGVPAFAQVQPSGFPAGVTPPIFGVPSSGVTGSGVVTSPQLLAPDGTAAAPSYSFASETNSGLYLSSAGNISLNIGGGSSWRTSSAGFTLKDTLALAWGSSGTSTADVSLSRGAANVLMLASGDSLNFGGVTSSDVKLKQNGTAIQARLGDDSGVGAFQGSLALASGAAITGSGGALIVSATAPTVTSAGTSPSIVANGTVASRVNVGTGGTATTIVLALPTATTGWNCDGENITATAANRANQRVVQQSSTTTAATLQNQTISTGAALAFTASDVVRVICFAY